MRTFSLRSPLVAGCALMVCAAALSTIIGGCPNAPQSQSTNIDTTTDDIVSPDGGVTDTDDDADSDDSIAVIPEDDAILVSIVMHFEEPPGYPNFVSDQSAFNEYRAALVTFAGALHNASVRFDFQSDWNFLAAIDTWDSGDAGTNGKNVVRWLNEDLGFSIDPHAHETTYNYADVAYLLEQLGVTPTGVVGGFIADPPNQSVLEQFWSAIEGDQYPGYFWNATVLWGGGTGNHVNESAMWASGIWRPQDRGHFLTHDDAAPLPVIGNFGGTWENLDLLLSLRDAGALGSGVHTCTIMTNGRDIVEPGFIDEFAAELAARRASTAIRWITLPEALEIWEAQYGSVANQVLYNDVAASAAN
ncbi:MAG: hypothetical protein ACKVS9_08365 [Phycisphaerae bacterium]